ncbi:hypothetical protein NHP21005_19670 (plasmid) [Helicobacter sp. NHP21005]|uniref:hypothetical protein n=1 Tax=Helicobacter felistomachi TaxID=3040201 RepID=UPI0025740140|nr:hypothetical protein [Helicobacter sp. NHP21005]BEG58279.1 hypothetical protein NHP21005_19670 [Helicobacter sp. NHP21005]
MIKTTTAKYSILQESNIAHDFKSAQSYGVYAYLTEKLGTNVWNNISRALEEVLGESYLIPDPDFPNVLHKAISKAKTRQQVERALKNHYGVGYVRFENDFIEVADQCLVYPSQIDKARYFALPIH